jgi:DNA-binding MarR family transcriptional regulator
MFTRAQLNALQKSRRYRMGRLFLLARADFTARLVSKMESDGHAAQHAVRGLLPFIDVENGTRAIDLARRMGVTKQAIAQMVSDLEQDGLVYRDVDEADGRAALIRFSQAGLEYLFQMNKSMIQVEREYERIVGKDTLATVRAALATIAYPDERLDEPES